MMGRLSLVLAGKFKWLEMSTKAGRLAKRTLTTRSDEYDFRSPFGAVTPYTNTIHELLVKSASKWGDRTALECGVTGQKVTYSAFLDQMQRVGGALQTGKGSDLKEGGAGPGDAVALLAVNSPEYCIAFGGILASGASACPINPTFTPNEVAIQLADSTPKILIVDTFLEEIAMAALSLLSQSSSAPPPALYVMGPSKAGISNLADISKDKSTKFAADLKATDNDSCVLAYSSGTTGLPKGVHSTQGAVKANLPAVLHPDITLFTPASGEYQPTLMGLIPFFHAYGLYMIACTGLLTGCRILTLPKFEPTTFISAVKKNQFEMLHVVPPLLNFLLTPFIASEDLDPLRVIMCSAAPCPHESAVALKEKAPNPVFFQELYGMTETMPSIATPRGQERIGAAGKLLAGFSARVVDLDTNMPLPPGQRGELWIRGPSVMKGYHNRPEETDIILRSDGWLKSGDVVTYDEDGYVFVVDRIKELIKVKGNQVSPNELEQELMKHEGVADAGVVAVADERAGEVPRAYVVLNDDDITADDLHSFLSTRLAKHKQLEGGIVFLDELPKSASGKLLRRTLKEMAGRG